MSTLSDNLKAFRKKRGLTQSQLANYVHVSQNAIYNWENGKREPSLEMLNKLADGLNVPLMDLLSYETEIEGIKAKSLDLTFLDDPKEIEKYLFTAFPELEKGKEQEEVAKKQSELYLLEEYLNQVGNFLYSNPQYKVLLDSSMKVKPEDVEFAKQMLDRINGSVSVPEE